MLVSGCMKEMGECGMEERIWTCVNSPQQQGFLDSILTDNCSQGVCPGETSAVVALLCVLLIFLQGHCCHCCYKHKVMVKVVGGGIGLWPCRVYDKYLPRSSISGAASATAVQVTDDLCWHKSCCCFLEWACFRRLRRPADCRPTPLCKRHCFPPRAAAWCALAPCRACASWR